MSDQRGLIFNVDAYAQGKMLDNSDWLVGEKRLPRRITPSDVDLVFDNGGMIIFAELSRHCSEWHQLTTGQRMLYENAIKGGAHCACLCRHSVSTPIEIKTRFDFDSFQVMLWDFGFVHSRVMSGTHWAAFVFDWFSSPEAPLLVRRKIIGRSALNGATPP